MPEQNRVQMRGGEGWFYREVCTPSMQSCRAARDDGVPAVQLPRGSLILHASPPPNPPRFSCVPFSDMIFEDSFGGLLVLKMGHAAYRWKSLDVFFPTV